VPHEYQADKLNFGLHFITKSLVFLNKR